MTKRLLFEIIQVSLGNRSKLSKAPSEKEWMELYELCQKQAITAFVYNALDGLSKIGQKPPVSLLYEWIGLYENIKARNYVMNRASADLYKFFRNNSFQSCVLKGQGLATLYPNPFSRLSGDVDLWVVGKRNVVIDFLTKNNCPIVSVLYHHVGAYVINGIDTEFHVHPSWLYNPLNNYRLQSYFRRNQYIQVSNFDESLQFSYPTAEFNVVYSLVHIYHHLMDEGVGLRQVIDYYFTLKEFICHADYTENTNCYKGHTEIAEITEIKTILRSLGLMKIAGALMWVLKVVCDMPLSMMICEPNTKTGKMLLEEIMATGNMGHYDTRYQKEASETVLARNLRKTHRWIKMLNYYPSEVLCIPGWKLWHLCWRKWHGYI